MIFKKTLDHGVFPLNDLLVVVLNSQQAQLQFGTHQNRDLQQDHNQYGAEKLVFEVIDELEPADKTPHEMREDLAALEELWLEKLQPYSERGYHKPPSNRSL